MPYGVPPWCEARRNDDGSGASTAACKERGGALVSNRDVIPAGLPAWLEHCAVGWGWF